MSNKPLPPFSARNRQDQTRIDDDFPVTARTGLLHILHSAVDRRYIPSWAAVAREVTRIARDSPRSFNESSVQGIREAKDEIELQVVHNLPWTKVYDLCERSYSHLAEAGYYWEDDCKVTFYKSDSQRFIGDEIERLFDEEFLGFVFEDGIVQRRGKRHTIAQVSKAERALNDQRLDSARRHFAKAQRHFRDRINPDLENSVKEAVCAVEAAAKELFPQAKANQLGDFIGWATTEKLFPKSISYTFNGLYGFRNSGEGVAHGGTTGGAVTVELAEYVLGMAASQILLLTELVDDEEQAPF